ncbi:MAG: hypothetical protein B7Y39_18835 [Bdellovibrio sp. 28-41-41]|nr:MAG: hypothetical protein B7Y39_18835 [Bdellovibrio sp. 28-41-41]
MNANISKNVIDNDRGQFLIQVIVVSAIMGILMMAMITIQINQSKENKALTEKLASLDFARLMTQSIAIPANCDSLISASNVLSGSSLTFDSTAVSVSSPHVVNLASALGVSSGGSVSALSSSLTLAPTAGIQLQVTSPTNANVMINFNQNTLIRKIKNLSFPIIFATSGPPAAATITGCGASTIAFIYTATVTAWRWPVATANCSPGQKVTGGGGSCSGGGGFNFIISSAPVSDTGWSIACDTPNNQNVTAVATAICK